LAGKKDNFSLRAHVPADSEITARNQKLRLITASYGLYKKFLENYGFSNPKEVPFLWLEVSRCGDLRSLVAWATGETCGYESFVPYCRRTSGQSPRALRRDCRFLSKTSPWRVEDLALADGFCEKLRRNCGCPEFDSWPDENDWQ
jgi:hypothetical protein